MVSIFGFNVERKSNSPFKEVGVSATAIQSGYVVDRERNPNLAGLKKYYTYEDIMANISIVSSSVRLYSDLFAKSQWKCDPVDDSTEAQDYADKLQTILYDQQQTWEQTVRASGLFVFWGYSLLEMTAKKLEDGTIGLASVEHRPCRTIVRWDVDDNGNVLNFLQQKPLSGEEIAIPREKCIYTVDKLLTDSPEGFGIFRSMAETALRLKDIQISEKIALDKDLRGTPIGRAPLAALQQAVKNGDITQDQMNKAIEGLNNMVALVKKGERTGIVLDSKTYDSVSDTSRNATSVPQWDLSLLNSPASGLADVDKIIRRINLELARIAGTEILLLGADGSGSLALSKDKTQSLMLRINGVLKDMAGQFNRDLVPFIWRLNGWPDEMMPRLVCSEISSRDVEGLANIVRELAASGVTLSRGDEAVNEIFGMLGLTTPETQDAVESIF